MGEHKVLLCNILAAAWTQIEEEETVGGREREGKGEGGSSRGTKRNERERERICLSLRVRQKGEITKGHFFLYF